jgi:4-amino-4-deoxy-L-arabinose transferase
VIGVLAGCAVLNKWLTGILVYAGWGINILLQWPHLRRKEMMHIGMAVAVTVLVFLPWQLYIHHRFPEEAAYEAALNNRHLWEQVEGHWGTNFFYLDTFPEYFGEIGWFLVPVGFVILLLQLRKCRIPNVAFGQAALVWFAVTFVFFSYVATTKIIGFFYIVVPLGILFIAVAVYEIQRQLQLSDQPRLARTLPSVLFTVVIVSIFNPERIAARHNPADPIRTAKIANVAVYQQLGRMIPKEVHIVVNANQQEHTLAMFYNTGLRVYEHLPYREVWDSLMQHNTPVVAFASRPGYELPDSIMNRSNVTIIYTALK